MGIVCVPRHGVREMLMLGISCISLTRLVQPQEWPWKGAIKTKQLESSAGETCPSSLLLAWSQLSSACSPVIPTGPAHQFLTFSSLD